MAQDFGMKISEPGHSVEAADTQLIASSSFPTLLTAFEGNVVISQSDGSSSGKKKIIVEHNLGFAPYCLIYVYQPNWPGDLSWPRYWSVAMNDIDVDSKTVYTTVFSGSASFPFYLHYVVFNYPIMRNFTAPILNTQSQPSSAFDPDFGLKASLPGKDVSSEDMRDFSVHSSARSPLIHASRYGKGILGTNYTPYEGSPFTTANDYVLAIQHNLGYAPLCLSALSIDGGSIWQVSLQAWAQTNVAWFSSGLDDDLGLLVLKDPLLPMGIVEDEVVYRG